MWPEEVQKQIPTWKKLGYELFYITIGKQLLVFRTISKREFEIVAGGSVVLKEAEHLGTLFSEQYAPFIDLALLWPKSLPDSLPASADKLLAEAIVYASGWVNTDRLTTGLDEARQKALSLEEFFVSRICTSFPSVHPDSVQDLKFNDMMRLLALSEIMTGIPIDLQPFIDPVGYEKKLEKEKKRAQRMQSPRIPDPRMRDPDFIRKLQSRMEPTFTPKTPIILDNAKEPLDFEKMNSILKSI